MSNDRKTVENQSPPSDHRTMGRRTVFILGMHRSGTSLLTALLRMAGVELGSDLLLGEAAENSRGFWEHREVVRINDELLAHLGLSWFVPSPLPPGYLDLCQLEPLAHRAANLLHREFAGAALWGIKDPRLCRLQGFWERACTGMVDELYAAHVFRHPLEVADSLRARNNIPTEQAMLLWLFHNLEAVLHPRKHPIVSVPMRWILQDPTGTISRLRAHFGDKESLSVAAAQEIRQFVEPALLHHLAAPEDERLDTPVGSLANRCHDCLERLAGGDRVEAELAEIHERLLAMVDQRRRSIKPRSHRTVDVIVPVYGGLQSTMRCIDAVLLGGGRFELLVINDASPDAAITERLRERAANGEFTLVENPHNLGFVATVNRGMQVHPDRDVVLLNADTAVPAGWLDRIQHTAYSNEWIGTVTPFSNNATICSYPLPLIANDLPAGYDVASLDAMFEAANHRLCLDIPTAVGFCMYIRRDCLEQVGPFDEEHFHRGYGEETDFSMRAAKQGWRNVAAADVFVYHEGCVSFGAEAAILQAQASKQMQKLHSEYGTTVERFLSEDPLAFARAAVDSARVLRRGPAQIELVMLERQALIDMRRRELSREKESLRRDVAKLDKALGHAQKIVIEREQQISELTAAFRSAEQFAAERLAAMEALDAQLRATANALHIAESLAIERLAALEMLSRQLRANASEAIVHATESKP
jgi:GT2 family glycosyltransferase